MGKVTEPKTVFGKVGPCLCRYTATGTYYALVKVKGRSVHRSLETDDRPPAKRRLTDPQCDLLRVDVGAGAKSASEGFRRGLSEGAYRATGNIWSQISGRVDASDDPHLDTLKSIHSEIDERVKTEKASTALTAAGATSTIESHRPIIVSNRRHFPGGGHSCPRASIPRAHGGKFPTQIGENPLWVTMRDCPFMA